MNEQKDTILITGSSGRIGYPLAKRLSESFNVVGFDRRAPSHPPPSAECLYVDLTLDESLRRGLQAIRDLHGNRIASVIHLAAYYDFSGAPSPLYEEITVRGTERLLRMLQDFEVEQFIFSSTDLVYASSAPGQHISEESPLDPKWPYPKSKVETEKVIHAERGNIPTVILRIAGVYDDLCHSIPLAQQIQRIYEHDITAYLFPGDISAGRQAFVHNEDVVDSILSAVARRRELPPEVMLLIGESKSLSYDELQRAFGQLIHGVEWKTHSLPNPLAKVGAWAQEKLPLGRPPFIKPWMIDLANDNSELDITRARTVLGWEPKHSLRDTLPRMVPALKADPWTWYRENEIKPPLWLRELAPALVGEQAKALGPHELMQLCEQIGREIAAPASLPMIEPPKHDMSKMGDSKGAGSMTMDMGQSDEDGMAKMVEPIKGEITATASPPMTEPPKHDMAKMDDSTANGNGSMTMDMGQSDEDVDEVGDKAEHLERLRVWQAHLEQAYQREVAAQKKEDAKAQKLMESDPRGHVEMMKMEQEHRQLALELPRALLQREAEVHQELLQAQAVVSAKLPATGTMMGQMVTMARWSQIPVLALGAWLIVTPFMLDYGSVPLQWSDIISGILVMTLGGIAFHTGRIWAAVASMVVGLWIAFAPLAFWAPNAAVYTNDTLVGALVIVFAFIIPMLMPMSGPTIPSGWTYNPSTWQQRAPILALGFLTFFMSRYMSAFELGHISSAWDPFFGNGTVQVLTSTVSKSFPISDAGLGAFTYLIEILSGFMGDTRRWRTMPWMVAIFGIAVVPLGIVSVVLIISQPVLVGAWCTFCLLSAFFMLIMVALSLDEVIAMLQFLAQTHRAGKSVWRTFWLGGNALGDDLTFRRQEKTQPREMFWGVTVPWNLLVIALLGVWLMGAPGVFQTQGQIANSDQVLGALVVTVAIIALAEVGRAARFINILLALAVILLPLLLGGGTLASGLNDLIVGVLIIGLSIPPGKIKNTYGNWNPLVV